MDLYFLRRSWIASSIREEIGISVSTLRCLSFFSVAWRILVANIFFSVIISFYQKYIRLQTKKFDILNVSMLTC